MDRISELPQPILHHILTFLSQKQSVQTCILSKSWRYHGSTRPRLEFLDESIPWPSFRNIVDETLQRYEDQNLSIDEFLLEVSGDRPRIVPFLKKWISIVVSLRGLKRLYLNFGISTLYARVIPRVVPGCAVPQVLFQAESIQELYLDGCKIRSAEKVMFKNLHTLSLRVVEIREETFEKIMSSCPLIQFLVLSGCRGLSTVKVKNAQNLKIFDCVVHAPNAPVIQRESHIEKDSSIEIVAPTTLQRIKIGSCHNWYCYHDNKFFHNLKSLCLDTVRLSTESFDIFSPNKIPCLECLVLAYCYGFEKFELSSRSIKSMTIKIAHDNSPFSAAIDAPNILNFELTCDNFREMPSPFTFTKNSSCDWKSHINVRCCVDSNKNYLSKWFLELAEILKASSQSQISLDISCFCKMNGEYIGGTYEGFNEPVVVEHLSGSFSSSIFPGFLNSLFSICRPRYIYNLPKMYRESLCTVRERKDFLWKQELEDMEEEKHYDASSSSRNNIRLRLKWRELS